MTYPTVIIHFTEDGDGPFYYHSKEVALLIIDDRVPNDRIYHHTTITSDEDMKAIIGIGPIGHKGDAKHAGVEARVNELLTGEKRLTVVSETEQTKGSEG